MRFIGVIFLLNLCASCQISRTSREEETEQVGTKLDDEQKQREDAEKERAKREEELKNNKAEAERLKREEELKNKKAEAERLKREEEIKQKKEKEKRESAKLEEEEKKSLFQAISAKNFAEVKRLIEGGLLIHGLKNAAQKTVLDLALEEEQSYKRNKSSEQILKYLVNDKSVDFEKNILAKINPDRDDLIALFLDKSADPNVKKNGEPVWLSLLKYPKSLSTFLRHAVNNFDINKSKSKRDLSIVLEMNEDKSKNLLEPLKVLIQYYGGKIDLNNSEHHGQYKTYQGINDLTQQYRTELNSWINNTPEIEVAARDLLERVQRLMSNATAALPVECQGVFAKKYKESYSSELSNDWKRAQSHADSKEELKTRAKNVYKRLSRIYHPDRLVGKSEDEKTAGEKEFKKISICNDAIKNL